MLSALASPQLRTIREISLSYAWLRKLWNANVKSRKKPTEEKKRKRKLKGPKRWRLLNYRSKSQLLRKRRELWKKKRRSLLHQLRKSHLKRRLRRRLICAQSTIAKSRSSAFKTDNAFAQRVRCSVLTRVTMSGWNRRS